MFGKGKILKHGAQAEAVVVDSGMSGYSNGKGINKWHLKLQVHFEDGTTVDASCSAYPTGRSAPSTPATSSPSATGRRTARRSRSTATRWSPRPGRAARRAAPA